jgi:hypothetical protein
MRIVALASFIGLVFATSANGQTSSQIATTKPAETYSYFKRALQRQRAGMDEVNGQKKEESMGLSSCSDATDYIGYDGNPNSIVAKTANLAFDVVYLQATLQVAGYPKSVWEPELFEYERTNLAEIDRYNTQKESPAKQRLAKKIERIQKSFKWPLQRSFCWLYRMWRGRSDSKNKRCAPSRTRTVHKRCQI